MMKVKNVNNGEELKRINSELFGPFGPVDEWGIVGGGTKTVTDYHTFTPNGLDTNLDFEWDGVDIVAVSS